MFRATTVLAVRHNGQAVMASDGQVTFGDTVVKQRARKIRRLYNDRVLAGFAGSAADSFALFSRFEAKLEQYRGNLERSAVELAKEWRTDRVLRRLEAMLVVMDGSATYLLSGTGDLIEPDDGIVAIGSGGAYALAAAKALAAHTALDARGIAEQAMQIAAGICIYSNDNLTVEVAQHHALEEVVDVLHGEGQIYPGIPFDLTFTLEVTHTRRVQHHLGDRELRRRQGNRGLGRGRHGLEDRQFGVQIDLVSGRAGSRTHSAGGSGRNGIRRRHIIAAAG